MSSVVYYLMSSIRPRTTVQHIIFCIASFAHSVDDTFNGNQPLWESSQGAVSNTEENSVLVKTLRYLFYLPKLHSILIIFTHLISQPFEVIALMY